MANKISELVFKEMAQQTNDPLHYIMAITALGGFTALSDKQDIVKAWNRVHKDKQLPLPK